MCEVLRAVVMVQQLGGSLRKRFDLIECGKRRANPWDVMLTLFNFVIFILFILIFSFY